jgi:DNA-binding transcriptional LysR family regulator
VPRYTLRQLEYFVAVADSGTVTAAAAGLHLSQSAMSTAVADLERALGVQLLMRHHARGVTLTPAGDQLLVVARQLLSQAEDLESSAHALGGELSGRVPLGCFAVLSPYLVPRVLAAADEQLPALQVEPQEETLDGVAEGLLAGRFELALTYDLGSGAGLVREPLSTVAPHAVLAASHPRAGQRSVRLADLAEEPFALLDLPHSREYFESVFAASGVEPPVRYRTRSTETVRALVGRGLAWGLLNLRPAHEQTVEGLPVVTLPLTGAGPSLTVVLARAATARPTRRADALAALCRDVLTERPRRGPRRTRDSR